MELRKYIRILLNIFIPLLTIYVICFWGPRFLRFFMPFVIGWVVAMIANPPVRFLEKRMKIVRRHSSVALIVGVLALVIVGLYLLIGKILREMDGFLTALPQLYEICLEEVTAAYGSLSHMFNFMPSNLETAFEQVIESVGAYLGDFVQQLAASAGGAVARTIPEVLVNTIVVLFSSYLFLAEHDKIVAVVRENLPETVKKYTGYLKKDIKTVICGYFLAQFRIMFVVGLMLFFGFMVLGVKYAFFLALVIAFLDFLPVFGTGTALIPWAVVKLFTGELPYAVGLILLYVLTQVVRQIIQPKIVGDSMGLPPLTTLFLLFLGFKLRGLAGMILAVPVGLIFINFYRYGAFDSLIENVRRLIDEINFLRREDGAPPDK